MNRRDTIIVAMLINTGLLVMLFVSALKTPSATEIAYTAPVPTVTPPPAKEILPPKTELVAIPADPIDQAIAQVQKHTPPPAPSHAIELPKPPKAPKEEKAPPVSSGLKVVVKKGDALDKLARAHGTSVDELMKVNHLTSPQLQIGQVLVLPAPKAAVPKPKVSIGEEKYYVVKNGDNLWKIAIENHIKVEELLKINNLDEKKAKMLRPGDKLLIKK